VRGSLSPVILWLTAAVTLWVGGFDILYACQDYDFDRSQSGLHSLPKKLGIAPALRVAALFHGAVVGCLAALLWASQLGVIAWVGLALVALLLFYEHSLVKPHDLSRINAAFFTVNGYIGILLLVFWGSAILLRQPCHLSR
jgi:4-hydroxybenzoate polyprenyltransferase